MKKVFMDEQYFREEFNMPESTSPSTPITTGITRTYLGDGVYVWNEGGYQVWLETSDGYTITNRIALDQDTWESLLRYMKGKEGL